MVKLLHRFFLFAIIILEGIMEERISENIFFIEAKESLDNFILSEFPDFSKKLQNHLVKFIPSMGHYEEEGEKYRPVLLFTNDINAILKAIPTAYKVAMFDDENEAIFEIGRAHV